MKHESIVVVYDSCQAIAEEIADKLGAETVSVQSMNVRQIENSQSLVLAVEFQDGGNLSPHWQYASQMFRGASLNGKNRTLLATISMQILPSAISTTGSAPSRLTYKTITIMQYILIVALEFVLAFTGVALLIRYYNHK